MLECRKCTPEHIEQLKLTMRKEDRVEALLSSGKSPAEVLDGILSLPTESYTWLDGGVVLCIFGVAQFPGRDDMGVPWLLASTSFEGKAKAISRSCKKHLARMSSPYKHLCNIVHAKNPKAIRLLTWLGFSFSEGVVLDSGATFLPFYKRVSHV